MSVAGSRTLALGRHRASEESGALRVTVVSGPDLGRSATVTNRPCGVGRAEGADLRLTDLTVSAMHLELEARGEVVLVRDLQSSNGVAIGGAWVERGAISPGTPVQIGSTVLQVEVGTSPAAADAGPDHFGRLTGGSPAMRTVYAMLAQVAPTDWPILVEGPPGSELDLVARSLHDASPRASGPFVAVDCSALPPALAEDMLFRDGGAFPAAAGGTLLLGEVGALPLEVQASLVEVLEQQAVPAAGGSRAPRATHGHGGVRLVSTSSRDLSVHMNSERFREDLYDALVHARIRVPALSQRVADIPALAYQILQRLPPDTYAARTIHRDALSVLRRREYPGDVRELEGIVARAALVAKGPTITAADLAFERVLAGEMKGTLAGSATASPDDELVPFKQAKRSLIDDFERDYLKSLVARSGDNLYRASILSGVERHHLRDLLRKHGLRGRPGEGEER